MLTGRPAICDPHVHLFVESARRAPYTLADLRADMADGHDVRSVVYVEAATAFRADGPEALRPVGETEWVVSVDAAGVFGAIVGWADLRLGDAVEEVLDAHVDAGRGRFRGVRVRTNWDESPELPRSRFSDGPGELDDAGLSRGVAAVGRRGLVLDVFVYFHQLGEVERLARAHADVAIVVDHFGSPLGTGPYAGRRGAVDAELRQRLGALAAHGNVHLKLGAIGWPGAGHGWESRPSPPGAEEVAATWGPLERWCIETFGPERTMCESNYPPDRASLPYRTIWDAHLLMTEHLSPSERAAVLHDTAVRVYGITRDAPR